jgi:hypothetical protein
VHLSPATYQRKSTNVDDDGYHAIEMSQEPEDILTLAPPVELTVNVELVVVIVDVEEEEEELVTELTCEVGVDATDDDDVDEEELELETDWDIDDEDDDDEPVAGDEEMLLGLERRKNVPAAAATTMTAM